MSETEASSTLGEAAPEVDRADSGSYARHRRTYQRMIVAAVTLAVVGSPLLMHGFARFVDAVSSGGLGTVPAALLDVARLAVSASPLLLAGFTWHRARALERILEEEDREKYTRRRSDTSR